jgi:pyruvate formate lyase activating enzyme
MIGLITTVKRLETHDGVGIRTTVFFKGCPLKCKWCHNPENLDTQIKIGYKEGKCMGCGLCANSCKNGVHTITNGVHSVDFSSCVGCGKCVDACPTEAITLYGKKVTAEELYSQLILDKFLFDESKGGVTFSGGEPLAQSDFLVDVLKLLKKDGINCNIDTSGFVPYSAFSKTLPFTDCYLYDIKHIDSDIHYKGTGVNSESIIENLLRLDADGGKTEIRIPLIPNFNDDETTINKIGKLLSTLKKCVGVKVLSYHSLAKSKYESVGKEFIEFSNGNLNKKDAQEILSKYVKIIDD